MTSCEMIKFAVKDLTGIICETQNNESASKLKDFLFLDKCRGQDIDLRLDNKISKQCKNALNAYYLKQEGES